MGRTNKQVVLSLLAKIDQQTMRTSIQESAKLRASLGGVAKAELDAEHASIRHAAALETLTATERGTIGALRQKIAVMRLDIQAQKDSLGFIQKQTVALDQQEGAIQRVTKAQQKMHGGLLPGKRVETPSTFERAGNLSTGVSALAQLAPGPAGDIARVVADLAGFVEQIPRLGDALTGAATAGQAAQVGATGAASGIRALVVSLGPIAAASVAVAGAYLLISHELNEGKKAAEQAASVERQLAEQRVKGSQESLRLAIEEGQVNSQIAQEQRRLAQIRLNDIEAENRAEAIRRNRSTPFSFEQLGQITETKKAIESYDTEIERQQQLVEALTQLQSKYNQVIIGQAEVTQRILEQGRERAQVEAEINKLSASGTREQLEARVAAIKEERGLIAAQIDELAPFAKVNQEVAAEIERLRDRERALAEETDRLTQEVEPLIAAREKETAAVERQKALREKSVGIVNAISDLEEGLQALTEKTTAERVRIEAEAAGQIIKINEQLAARTTDILDTLTRANAEARAKLELQIATLETEASEQEKKIRTESADRINELEERAARERQRIIENYNDAANDAIQNRDAVALDRAQRERDKGLKETDRDLKSGIKQEKKALEARLAEDRKANETRIRELRASYEQERRDRQAAADQRINDLRAAADQEINLVRERASQAIAQLNERYRAEEAAMRAHFIEELRQYGLFFGNLETTTINELIGLAQHWADFYRDMANYSPSAPSSGTSSAGSDSESGTSGDGAFASGGVKRRSGIASLAEDGPEIVVRPSMANLAQGSGVLNAERTRQVLGMGRSVTLNMAGMFSAGAFQASGSDSRQVAHNLMQQLERRFPEMLERTLAKALKD